MIEIVHRLRMARGKQKLTVLKHETDNLEWQSYLQRVYDSSINYLASAPSDNTFKSEINMNELIEDLDLLAQAKSSTAAHKQAVRAASKKYGELFRLALKRSLNAGVSVTTINKAYPGLIPEFKVMLANDAEVESWPVYMSIKYDGVRLLAFVHNHEAVLKTRGGKVLHCPHLIDQMAGLPEGVYDGELVIGTGSSKERTNITGHVNRILKGTATELPPDYNFYVFDYLTLADWRAQHCDTAYRARNEFLTNLFDDVSPSLLPNVKQVEQKRVHSAQEVQEVFDDLTERGFEGLILRYPIDPYVWKRSPMLMKRKLIKETKATVVGVHDGTGKYAGLVGALECIAHYRGEEVRFEVGSGLSDYDRSIHADEWMNRQIEVIFNDYIKAQDSDTWSLFLPRFKRIAGDQNV